MNNKPRNPSAFPKTKTAGDVSITEGGMTLRDYFAAKAMAAVGARGYYGELADLAEDAYALADAMLAERERTE